MITPDPNSASGGDSLFHCRQCRR